MDICEECVLHGRCDGRCGDTDPRYYAFEEENDNRDIAEQYKEYNLPEDQ